MRERIIQLLKRKRNLTAKQIARFLSTDRTTVNRILYNEINSIFIRDDLYQWNLIRTRTGNKIVVVKESLPIFILVNTIREIIDRIVESDSSFFFPRSQPYGFLDDDKKIRFNVDYFILTYYLDIYSFIIKQGPDSLTTKDTLIALLDVEGFFDDEILKEINEKPFNGFCLRENRIPSLFISIFAHDQKYKTCYFELITHCFEKIGDILAQKSQFIYPYSVNDGDVYRSLLCDIKNSAEKYYSIKSKNVAKNNISIINQECNDTEEDLDFISCYYCNESYFRIEMDMDKYGNYICDNCYAGYNFDDSEYDNCKKCEKNTHKSVILRDENDDSFCVNCWELLDLSGSSYLKCSKCGSYIHKMFAKKEQGLYVCKECLNKKSYVGNTDNVISDKKYVNETCETCRFKHNGNCINAKHKGICSEYKYYKQ